MSLPVIGFRSLPADLREWGRVLFDLNDGVRKGRNRIFAKDQKFINQIGAANKQSTQTVQPVTATDSGGGLAQIDIASHSVQFGFGTVAYGSGTISGLANDTLYYVYAEDPEYEGGAVTYFATTNKNIPTSDNGFYYLGKVTTPAPAAPPASGGGGGGGGGNGQFIP